MNNLVLYVTLNYPDRKHFFEILDVIEENEVGYLELGIPVSNPYMDGKIVREAQRKVLKDISFQEIISVLKEIKRRYSFKVILMTYFEGVDCFQLSNISKDLYNGILCVDASLPKEQYPGIVHIITSEMDRQKIDGLLLDASQFIYVTSGNGKTGEFTHLPNEYIENVNYIKSRVSLPVFVGFGIKTDDDIKQVIANGADGAIIGSEFLKTYNKDGISGIKKYLSALNSL